MVDFASKGNMLRYFISMVNPLLAFGSQPLVEPYIKQQILCLIEKT